MPTTVIQRVPPLRLGLFKVRKELLAYSKPTCDPWQGERKILNGQTLLGRPRLFSETRTSSLATLACQWVYCLRQVVYENLMYDHPRWWGEGRFCLTTHKGLMLPGWSTCFASSSTQRSLMGFSPLQMRTLTKTKRWTGEMTCGPMQSLLSSSWSCTPSFCALRLSWELCCEQHGPCHATPFLQIGP